jgi:predicted TPR repeat methyltransferase
MICVAEKKAVYDQLHVSELIEFLSDCRENFRSGDRSGCFVYFGDLEPLFSCLEKRLNHGACFIFSTESCPDEGYTFVPPDDLPTVQTT